MRRRQFLTTGLGALAAAGLCHSLYSPSGFSTGSSVEFPSLPIACAWRSRAAARPPAFSVVPVVGDGKWIWKDPPKDQTGYLEPRSYSLDVGIEMEGLGGATDVMSTTTVPVEHPEQKIEDVKIETRGCEAAIRVLAPGAAQLVLTAGQIAKGQIVSAVAHYKLTLKKEYHAYSAEQFPQKQKLPLEVERAYLQDSPGIQTKAPQVRALARELAAGATANGTPSKHPWDIARAFAAWIPKNIRPQIGSYTSVTACVDDRRGDCEEMAGLFVAMCRVLEIPARLVWVPNHVWAEIFLADRDGAGHWIPVHTACYFWFGYNGAHELVLQKGDRVDAPERHTRQRLLEDWTRWQGRGPRVRYTGKLTPLASEGSDDPGPGGREKDATTGEWKVTGSHPFDRYVRR